MNSFTIKQVGTILNDQNGCRIQFDKSYQEALRGLDGFSHIQILWIFHHTKAQTKLTEVKPYTKGPAEIGVFATRSPNRPNPLALSVAYITYIDDIENVEIGLAYCDADNNSPVVDIKPYTPALDRVEEPSTPQWCAHWPKSNEESAYFDWAGEFDE